MFSGSKKPYSSISVHIERLTSETYSGDDLAEIPNIIEVIKLQDTGSTEAARALRKKLKYGSVHRQLKALAILDVLIQNAGPIFQRSIFNDEPLLERLRIAATDPVSDAKVRTRCKELFGQWAASLSNEPGLQGAAALYKQLPRTRKPQADRREQSKVLRETEEQAQRDDAVGEEEPRSAGLGPSSPRASVSRTSSVPSILSSGPSLVRKAKKKNKSKAKAFNLEREKPALLQTIASSQVASTNLNNALKLVNREHKRVSEDAEVRKRFETCKGLRRQILRYIQYVESDEFLGGLIHANEELVTALMAFEILDKSVDHDSDSELEETLHVSRAVGLGSGGPITKATEGIAGLSFQSSPSPRKPGFNQPTPNKKPVDPGELSSNDSEEYDEDSDLDKPVDNDEDEDEDENNPFGDRNAAGTPVMEEQGFSWKEV